MTNISKSTNNKFQIIFPLLPFDSGLSDQNQFKLNIIDGVLPSFDLSVEDVPWRGGKVKYEMGFEGFGEWTTTFAIDSNFTSWQTISNWMFNIANNNDIHGLDDQSHVTDANLHILDNFNNKILDIQFFNVWPSNLGEVSFSYADNSDLLTCSVTFQYDRFEVV